MLLVDRQRRYNGGVDEVGVPELQRAASEPVRRTEAGEHAAITVAGRPAAVIGPVAPRPWRRWAEVADLLGEAAEADSVREADRDRVDDAARDPYGDH